ncbi:AAA family ATPase [Patulibacter sp. NPDC049589]|uniref:AAA family ATPase n=1 Tax=Patulibacter sp. NPDC049589 TaxID=3154731 RepID=UPI003429CD55
MPPAPWPLVGRDAELAVLRSALAGPRPRSVVLVGPAGVGKTRLARAAAAEAARPGPAPRWVTATHSSARTPLGVFSPLLGAADAGAGETADTYEDLLRRSARVLASESAGRAALFVDDAHLLDDASAGLLQQLVATGAVAVVLTVRSGEPAPEAVTALWKDELAVRLELRLLDPDAVDALLGAALGGQVDRAAVAELAAHSGGNVLFLRELTLGALADGTLVDELGVWRLRGPLAPSDRIVELVGRRLSGLDEGALAVLELVAYAEPLGADDLAPVADAALLDRLHRAGLLVTERDGRRLRVRLAHPLYADVLRRRTSAVRVATMARALAERAERAGVRRRGDDLRLGLWRLDGGGGDPGDLLRAARTARWHYDFGLAERLASAAADAGAGFEARLLRAQTAALQGRPDEAGRQMAALVGAATGDAERARLAIAHIDVSWLCLGRVDEGLEVAAQAEVAIADPDLRDEIAGRRAGLVLGSEGPGAAAAIAVPLLRAAEGRSRVWLGLVASYGLGRLGRTTEALGAADRGYAAGQRLIEPDDWYPWFNLYARCEALAHAGRFADAEALARAQHRRGLQDGSSEARAWFLWHLCRTARDRGDVGAAERDAREAITLLRRLGRPGFEHSLLSLLAMAQGVAGDHAGAEESLGVLDRLGIEAPLWSWTDHLMARAWAAIAGGRISAAHRILVRAADDGERIGDLTGAAAALHDVARTGGAAAVRDRLVDLAGRIDGDLAVARRDHVVALCTGDAPSLESAAAAFHEMGAALLAAEAATDAAGAWRAAGSAGRADAAMRRAAALAEACPEARTPALASIEVRERLTPAERETALLAAAGRSNREIAAELQLSVRTIANRLQRTYNKLGISSRVELGRLVR